MFNVMFCSEDRSEHSLVGVGNEFEENSVPVKVETFKSVPVCNFVLIEHFVFEEAVWLEKACEQKRPSNTHGDQG